jgi:hypothetical protein
MTERHKGVPAAEAASPPAPVPETLLGAMDDAFRAEAAYVLAKNVELYRRLAQGPTGRERPRDGCGASRDPETDRSDAGSASPEDAGRPTGGA